MAPTPIPIKTTRPLPHHRSLIELLLETRHPFTITTSPTEVLRADRPVKEAATCARIGRESVTHLARRLRERSSRARSAG